MSEEKPFKMLTPFGRRHGWEVQHLMLGPKHFYRVTARTGCRPASPEEIVLWRRLSVDNPTEFRVKR